MDNPKKKLPNYIRYSGAGIQIAATVFLGVIIGQWLDKKFDNEANLFTIILSLLMIFVVLYQIVKMIKND